ncbi:MAG: hypothetical protein LBT65_09905 [Synergistaceae bacterium]|jgi:hypothetical protein|nr:hypothetical protein [Synergistaceae bacterium]
MRAEYETKRPGEAPNTGDNPEKQKGFDHDGLWKDLIEKYFYQLLERAVPGLFREADTSRKPRFLDKEFRDILNTSDPEIHTSPNFADYVLDVPLKKGSARWILLHLESQGPGGGRLAVRMYDYKSLIYVHYRREPVALAIIIGGHKKEKRYYSHSQYGTKVVYEYNNLVLAELDDEELLKSDNPLDLALYAAKQAARYKEDLQKYRYLRTLASLLAERGLNREEKRDLLLFLERILCLKDAKLKKKYKEYRQQLDKEGKIVYIPFYEQEEADELIRSSMEKGKEEMARNLLAHGVPLDIIARSAGLPPEKIQGLIS